MFSPRQLTAFATLLGYSAANRRQITSYSEEMLEKDRWSRPPPIYSVPYYRTTYEDEADLLRHRQQVNHGNHFYDDYIFQDYPPIEVVYERNPAPQKRNPPIYPKTVYIPEQEI